jgi:hypothetical protein
MNDTSSAIESVAIAVGERGTLDLSSHALDPSQHVVKGEPASAVGGEPVPVVGGEPSKGGYLAALAYQAKERRARLRRADQSRTTEQSRTVDQREASR